MFTGSDVRASQLSQKTHQSMHAEGQKSGGDGADKEDEYVEDVICGQCDKPLVKVATDPRVPTQGEIDEHCVTHLLHRSWCEVFASRPADERMPMSAKRRMEPSQPSRWTSRSSVRRRNPKTRSRRPF